MLDVSAIQAPTGSRAGVLASLVFLSAWWTVQVVGAAPSWHATVTNGAAGVATPLGRMDAAMASQQGRWAFLHGGYGGSTHTSLLTDLWALDGSTGQWLLLGDVPSTGNTTSPWPLPQAGGRAYDSTWQRLVIFGGLSYTYPNWPSSGTIFLNLGWVYELNASTGTTGSGEPEISPGGSWSTFTSGSSNAGADPSSPSTAIWPTGNGAYWPAPRAHAAYSSSSTAVYVFGGVYWQGDVIPTQGIRHTLNDVWRLHLSCLTWTLLRVPTQAGMAPQGRIRASATYLYWSNQQLFQAMLAATTITPAQSAMLRHVAIPVLTNLTGVTVGEGVDALLVAGGEVDGFAFAPGTDGNSETWVLMSSAVETVPDPSLCLKYSQWFQSHPPNSTWVQLAFTSPWVGKSGSAAWLLTPQMGNSDAPALTPSGVVVLASGLQQYNPETGMGQSMWLVSSLDEGGAATPAPANTWFGDTFALPVATDIFPQAVVASIGVMASNAPQTGINASDPTASQYNDTGNALADVTTILTSSVAQGSSRGWLQVGLSHAQASNCASNTLTPPLPRFGATGAGVVILINASAWAHCGPSSATTDNLSSTASGVQEYRPLLFSGRTLEGIDAQMYTLSVFPSPDATGNVDISSSVATLQPEVSPLALPLSSQFARQLPQPFIPLFSPSFIAYAICVGVVYTTVSLLLQDCSVRRFRRLYARLGGNRALLRQMQLQDRHATQLSAALRYARGGQADVRLAALLAVIESEAAAHAEAARRGVPDEVLDALPTLAFVVAEPAAVPPRASSSIPLVALSYFAKAAAARSTVTADVASSECPICLSEYLPAESLHRLPCGHFFHAKCILHWLRATSKHCPVCKHNVMLPFSSPTTGKLRGPLAGHVATAAASGARVVLPHPHANTTSTSGRGSGITASERGAVSDDPAPSTGTSATSTSSTNMNGANSGASVVGHGGLPPPPSPPAVVNNPLRLGGAVDDTPA